MKTTILELFGESEIPDDFTGKAIYPNGDVYYFRNGLKHRDGGLPAAEWCNGNKFYYVEGKRHRIGGPAAEWTDGHNVYIIFGKEVSKEAHDLLWNFMKLKGIEL